MYSLCAWDVRTMLLLFSHCGYACPNQPSVTANSPALTRQSKSAFANNGHNSTALQRKGNVKILHVHNGHYEKRKQQQLDDEKSVRSVWRAKWQFCLKKSGMYLKKKKKKKSWRFCNWYFTPPTPHPTKRMNERKKNSERELCRASLKRATSLAA